VIEVDAVGSGGFGIKGIFGVDPCADRTLASTPSECRDCYACAAGGGGAGEFCDGSDGNSTVEESIDLGDSGGDDFVDCLW
jgi:hypothetical protein